MVDNEDLGITEFLVIKDLYICGRMNLMVGQGLASVPSYSTTNLKEYKSLSRSYITDSIAELKERVIQLQLIHELNYLNLLIDTSANSFDDDLMNDMLLDYFGSKDSIAFISAYNYFATDFEFLVKEYLK